MPRELSVVRLDGEKYLAQSLPREWRENWVPVDLTEMETGDRLTAEHLIAQGCRHLIHISGVHETAMPADERAAGFCEVCEQKNVQYQVVGTHAYEYNHLEYHEVLEQLLLQHPDTDGIFASSDLIAAQLLSFDPNIREPLWRSLEETKRQTAYGMEVCDVLKISDNEIRWFTGEEDFDRGVDMLWREYHIPLILLSMGSEGSRAYCGSRRAEQPAFLQEGTIETTGAGDTFGACCLHYILEHGVAGLGTTELQEMLRFANAAASIVTTRRGALRVMPEPEEIHAFLAEKSV